MSVGADYIADWTAWDPVLQKVLRRAQHCWGISIGNSMICSGIYAKYHVQIMLLFVYTITRKRFVIFTCRYFKLNWNTTALSQSDCRNFSRSTIKCPYKGLEPHYVEADKLSTYNGHILPRKRVVIPERGQQQLLKGNAHPGEAAMQKMWRVATYGSQGRMMTLKLRSSCDNCPCKPECFWLFFDTCISCVFNCNDLIMSVA